MKAKIVIEIKRIKSFKVDNDFMKKNPKIIKSTEKTINELCKKIDEYFRQYNIITLSKFEAIEHG